MGKTVNVSFNRIEELVSYFQNSSNCVVVSFDSVQHGIVQLGRDADGVRTFNSEPDKYHFTEGSWEYMVLTVNIVYRMVESEWDDSRFRG